MFNETFIRYRSRDQNIKHEFRDQIKHEFLSNFNLGVSLSLAAGKYFTKIIFDIKIKIGIFEISNVPNFNRF